MLMVEENLMMTIIRTFVDHLRHRDPQGRFQFDRYTAQQAFKFGRVQSLIGDLKYEPIRSVPGAGAVLFLTGCVGSAGTS